MLCFKYTYILLLVSRKYTVKSHINLQPNFVFYQFHIVAQFKRQFSGFFFILWFQILRLFYILSFMTNFIMIFFKLTLHL